MKRSERFKRWLKKGFQNISNEVYNDLPKGGKRLVNRGYGRYRKSREPVSSGVKRRSALGRAEIRRRVTGSSDSIDRTIMREFVGFDPRDNRKKKVVGDHE